MGPRDTGVSEEHRCSNCGYEILEKPDHVVSDAVWQTIKSNVDLTQRNLRIIPVLAFCAGVLLMFAIMKLEQPGTIPITFHSPHNSITLHCRP